MVLNTCSFIVMSRVDLPLNSKGMAFYSLWSNI